MLRADFGPIIVRRGANIQDGSVLHGGADPVTEVGDGATIGHLCVVHGAVIGAEALVGNGATVLDGASVGRRALIAAGATVPPGLIVPDGMLAAGVPARIVGEVTGRAASGWRRIPPPTVSWPDATPLAPGRSTADGSWPRTWIRSPPAPSPAGRWPPSHPPARA